MIRDLFGMVLVSLVLPMIVFVPLTYLPATKKRHKLKYAITGAIAVSVPWIMVNGGAPAVQAVQATIIIAGLLYWSYLRAASNSI